MAFALMGTAAFAQNNGGYSIYDSTVVRSKDLPQQTEFWNNAYDYPAKPRNMWEVGASLGMFTISSDVTARPFTFPNFSVHVRKALGYVFSLRLQYLNATGKGLNYNAAMNYYKNPAWNANLGTGKRYFTVAPDGTVNDGAGNTASRADFVFYNYKTKVQDLGLQGIVSLNNIRFHKNKTALQIYAGGGIGATIYESKVNALDENGNNYAAKFNALAAQYNYGSYKDRKKIISDLKGFMDDTYETDAESQGKRRQVFGNGTLKPSGTILVGIAYKLGKRINLALEDRHTFVKDDLLDGQRWQEHAWGDAALTRDFDSYNYLSLGLNFNLGAKSVEPLYWLNPLNYAYSELNNPKHMKLPKPVFDDADGDGVVDQLDREPNTPADCPVDTHGVSKDTDGDGVPDCKDKQLITPTECQPVDADGVGKCPEPECCKNAAAAAVACPTDYPSLNFRGATLSSDAKAMLASVASKMKANPNCNISLNGYPEASKASQALCQKRLDAAKMYLVEKEGISADRISTNCEIGGGDKNTVDVKSN
ncbi:MAG: hypothetical protein WAT19_06870 [Ferruginibacter sp.]